MRTKDPQGVQALLDQARGTWGGKQFSTDEFRDFLRTGNAGLNRFYKQAPTAQGAASLAGSPPAINEAEISGIREHFSRFGDRLPSELNEELDALEERLSKQGG